ncbi:hypothetical protein ACFU99_09005 [Streptomyces sp. NPDC057654]|uniref:hypothetical protein n=1 Tax=Streptomyces sp. NPDC057654 TaxID=3346196 RepID=UPI0036C62D41
MAQGASEGFIGAVKGAEITVDSICSCGRRHRASPERTQDKVTVSAFKDAGIVAATWVCRRTGQLGRGPLSQAPLFYSVRDDALHFSTDLRELVGETPPWSAAVAAALGGVVPHAPLTPYENVFQLACGTTLTVTGGKERLELMELGLRELIDSAQRLVGHRNPTVALRRALAHAVEDSLAGADESAGVLGDGGGLGAAAIAAAGGDRLRRVHVHVNVPVLQRRRDRLMPGTEVIDGSPAWLRASDPGWPRYFHEADAWPPEGGATWPGSTRPLSGAVLADAMAAPPPTLGRLRSGWVRLADASPNTDLRGRRGWRAWLRPKPIEAAAEAPPADGEGESPPPERMEHGKWLSLEARGSRVPVSAAYVASHLVPADDDTTGTRAMLTAIIKTMEATPLSGPGLMGRAPVRVCAHPVVVGTLAGLALDGRLSMRTRHGYADPVPLLRSLVPSQWRPADVAPMEREQLLAAAFVTRALGRREQRTALMDRVESSPWIDRDALKAVLADSHTILFDALALQRLHVTAVRYGDALYEGVAQ